MFIYIYRASLFGCCPTVLIKHVEYGGKRKINQFFVDDVVLFEIIIFSLSLIFFSLLHELLKLFVVVWSNTTVAAAAKTTTMASAN